MSVSTRPGRPLRVLLALLGMASLSTAVADQPLSTTPTHKLQGRINYVTTGATFRTLRNSSTASDSCQVGTTATSQAVAGIPAGATVVKALLYWAASATRSGDTDTVPGPVVNDTVVSFDGQTVTAATSYTDSTPLTSPTTPNRYNSFFGNVADITPYVSGLASPNKTYSMSGLSIQSTDVGTLSTTAPARASSHCGSATVLGGWGLYIIYSVPTETYKNLVIYEGFERIQNATTSRTVTGLVVPTTFESRTSILAFEGDETLNVNTTTNVAESLSFGAGQAPTAINNVFNVGGSGSGARQGIFNSTISTGLASGPAATASGRDDTFGVDFDTFDVTSKTSAGANSATINIVGSQDLFFLSSVPVLVTSGVADLSLTKTVSTATPLQGSNVTYTVTLRNAGPDPATSGAVPGENTQVRDLLPAGLSYVSSTAGAGTYTPATGIWSLPTPLSGAATTLTITARVTGSGTITNVAEVMSSPQPDSDALAGNGVTSEDDYASVPLLVLLPPTVSKGYSPDSILSDSSTSSTLTITLNNPNSAAITLSSALNDNIGAGLTMTGISDTCPGTASFSGTTITYPSGATLGAGSCTITATVISGTAGSYPNTIAAGALQTSAGSNAAAATSTLTVATPSANLAVTKIASKSSYAAGEDVVYTVSLSNAGPRAAGGAVLSDTLPTQIAAVNWTCVASGGAACPAASGTGNLSQTVATLPSGGSLTYTLAGLARTSGSGIVNTASVALPGGVNDPNTANNSASATIAITNPAASTYTGPGSLAPSMACMDFTGMPPLAVGGSWSKTITTADGIALSYTVSVTGVSMAAATGTPGAADGLRAYTPGSGTGDRWQLYFGAGKVNALAVNPDGRDVRYTVSAYAQLGSLAVPLQLLTGSAEEDGVNGDPARPLEYVQSTTNGTAFALADVVSSGGPFRRVTVSGAGKTIRASTSSLDAAGAYTQVNIALFSTQKRATPSDPLVLTSRMLGAGNTAQGFCAGFYADRGDAPTSYGGASHFSDTTYSPLLSDGTFTLDQLTRAVQSDTTPQWLGALRPDVESAPRGTTGTGDSDDALGSPPALTTAHTGYALTLNCNNAAAVASTVAGWLDFNQSGSFEAAERASASCPAGGGSLSLSWSALSNLPVGSTYARLRISGDAGSLGAPSGAAPDGEVEDYAVTITAGADLQVVKVGPAYARPGETLTYTVTVSNLNGSAPATTTVTDTLPAGLSYVGSSPAASVSGQTLTWTLSNLVRGASQSYSVTVTAPSAATLTSTPGARTPTNAAGVSSTLTDPSSANNSATATTAMVYGSLVKRVRNVTQGGAFGTSGSGLPGELLEYCIDYSNLGGAALPGFAIADQVPGNTAALLSAYDAEEPSTASGFGVRLLRGAVTSYLSSASGALNSTGGGFGRGTMTVALGTLGVGESGSACFQATIR